MSHAATFPTVTADPRSVVANVVSRIVDAVMAANARHAEHRAYKDLLDRDAETLRDLGITRGQIRRAMNACRN